MATVIELDTCPIVQSNSTILSEIMRWPHLFNLLNFIFALLLWGEGWVRAKRNLLLIDRFG